jgi:hypothetical protein
MAGFMVFCNCVATTNLVFSFPNHTYLATLKDSYAKKDFQQWQSKLDALELFCFGRVIWGIWRTKI